MCESDLSYILSYIIVLTKGKERNFADRLTEKESEGTMYMRLGVNQKKTARKEVLFLLAAAALVVVTLLMVYSTRQHIQQRKGDAIQMEETENYREVEEQYRLQVQEVMTQAGYPNSGVTMTYVTGENGDRQYTVQIHHRRLEKMKAEEQEQLKRQVLDVTGQMGACFLFLT